MTREQFDQEEVISPYYWDGYNILSDTAPFVVANKTVELEHKVYRKAKVALEIGARALYHGSSQEVSYLPGTYFNPTPDQLADGSIVIAEYEGLLRNIAPDNPLELPESDNIRLPLIDYWRENLATPTCGLDRILIPDHNALYNRLLAWGVLATDPKQNRALQTFEFKSLIPTKDGSFKYVDKQMSALLLPIEPGGVSFGSSNVDDIHRLVMYRIQGLHVVHPADSDVTGTPIKKRRVLPGLGRVLTPQPLS